MTNLLEYLDNIVTRVPDKLAYSDGKDGLTFLEVNNISRAVGSALLRAGHAREPVLVFMPRHPKMIAAFFGVLRSGGYYVPIDAELSSARISGITQTMNARAMIISAKTRNAAQSLGFGGDIYDFDELAASTPDDALLTSVREKAIDIDPAYVVFTSGSTGVPKGVCACHRSVIDYVERLSEILSFGPDTVFGNQTPLYVDACLKELYPTLKFGATTFIIPKTLFMFPIKLLEFMNEHRVNTICWVVSAMTMISSLGAFKKLRPEYLKTVAFGSEVFPIKQFRLWREALPDATFTNLYGPTEGTGMCCYYRVDREFADDEHIPIGRPFPNCEILLLDENDRPASEGEICIRGTKVTLGYYNNPQKTAECYVQNPLNTAFPELIYRTGDVGAYNGRGELAFISRKDHQIKIMGHRVELGEIEAAADRQPEVGFSCALFDRTLNRILLVYSGNIPENELLAALKAELPVFMTPSKLVKVASMPLSGSGKINRELLRQTYCK